MWELVVLYGVTKYGIGGSETFAVQSYEQCRQVIQSTVISNDEIDKLSKNGAVVLLCLPKQK